MADDKRKMRSRPAPVYTDPPVTDDDCEMDDLDSEMDVYEDDANEMDYASESSYQPTDMSSTTDEDENDRDMELSDTMSEQSKDASDFEHKDNQSDDDDMDGEITSEYSLYSERDEEYVPENFDKVERKVVRSARGKRKRIKSVSLSSSEDENVNCNEKPAEKKRKKISMKVPHNVGNDSDDDRESYDTDETVDITIRRPKKKLMRSPNEIEKDLYWMKAVNPDSITEAVIYDSHISVADHTDGSDVTDNDSFSYESACSSVDKNNDRYEWEPIPIIDYKAIEFSKMSKEERENREREDLLKQSNQAECKTPSPKRHGVDHRFDEHYFSWEVAPPTNDDDVIHARRWNTTRISQRLSTTLETDRYTIPDDHPLSHENRSIPSSTVDN